jgi:hypothetical protein
MQVSQGKQIGTAIRFRRRSQSGLRLVHRRKDRCSGRGEPAETFANSGQTSS